MLREAVGDLNRMRQILQVVVKHGFGDLLGRARIFERLGMKRPADEAATVEGLPQRLTRMLSELGPTFIKLGQILSTRPDLVPEAYLEPLRTLQDRAPPFPLEEVRRVLAADLGGTPESLFGEFAAEPMASASIAQVHRATTHDGQEVAVKVRRPGIEHSVRADLDILYYLAHLISAVVEDGGLLDPVEVVREFDRAIAQEMDFKREAATLRQFADNFRARASLLIPEPIERLSGAQVVTMTFLGGQHLSEVTPCSEQAQQAARCIVDGLYHQVLVDGVFHTDPHPGNLRFFPDGRVGLMDFGQVGRLTEEMRQNLMLLSLGVVLKDPDTIARMVYRLGRQEERADLGALKDDVEALLDGALTQKLGQIDAASVVRKLLDLSARHHIRVPADYVLLAKAIGTVDGTVRTLCPDIDMATLTAPYVKRLISDRFSLDDLRGGLGRTLLQLSGFLNEVPQQVSQILLDMEGGRLTLNVRDPEVARLRGAVRGLGMDVFWGLVAAGLLAGGLPALLGPGPTPGKAWWALGGALAIMAIATLRYYLTPALHKLNLRTWLERRWGEDAKRRGRRKGDSA
ncbi:MAG TPA: AarF/ABC1/UbiB kinase family protein [Myxococcota bacterium]|nr:AarF/ABC1/UbiB kinase family protein [Myxococcota bacterium]HRY95996.1 AarF/ABC1/UbiB kinase family protein [Myxococcota bacterium]HSA21792.1 AarF/ABC1/UbiB kinase family protein [Myxococcota bacterium]